MLCSLSLRCFVTTADSPAFRILLSNFFFCCCLICPFTLRFTRSGAIIVLADVLRLSDARVLLALAASMKCQFSCCKVSSFLNGLYSVFNSCIFSSSGSSSPESSISSSKGFDVPAASSSLSLVTLTSLDASIMFFSFPVSLALSLSIFSIAVSCAKVNGVVFASCEGQPVGDVRVNWAIFASVSDRLSGALSTSFSSLSLSSAPSESSGPFSSPISSAT
ncbi:unnamed protein product [Owenia fusiformis]|uniref:Uncharacterized protein n=1 Tax=Owenia fusiformis TaxID=6347 RepID=A0A8J1TYG0_OWEFU|nr:unnamed protein product [Owenia fusiformis]